MEYQGGYGNSFGYSGMNNNCMSSGNSWGNEVSGGNNVFENDLYRDPMFNPVMQYEQAYMYYKYLTQQIEYKIKCREYDKMCGYSSNNGNSNNSRNESRRIE